MGILVKWLHLTHRAVFNEKTDRVITMMSKFTAQDDNQTKQLKPKIYQSKRRGQMRNF